MLCVIPPAHDGGMRTELLSPTTTTTAGVARQRSTDLRLDLPSHVVARLADRANDAGQSLEWYINSELGRLATRPTADELLQRIRNPHRSAA